eukprot:8964645-Lingulodinium_polyedra.AAC.1
MTCGGSTRRSTVRPSKWEWTGSPSKFTTTWWSCRSGRETTRGWAEPHPHPRTTRGLPRPIRNSLHDGAGGCPRCLRRLSPPRGTGHAEEFRPRD